jgi:hypothetical protein
LPLSPLTEDTKKVLDSLLKEFQLV